jgi:rSAM/selenodomain-associated transferase 2
MTPAPRLSVIVPVLDEAAAIQAALRALAPLRERGHEVIVVDGGSCDGTPGLCAGLSDVVLASARGRGVQAATGAAAARGQVLLFLHADTRLPPQADALIEAAVARGALWGRFDVRIEGRSALLPLVAAAMNRRSRWSGIATGDQAMFVTRAALAAAGGVPCQPLMEDIELSRRLRRLAPPACLRDRVVTSGRRWEQRGVWRTIATMWWLRLRYWLGAAPEALERAYR